MSKASLAGKSANQYRKSHEFAFGHFSKKNPGWWPGLRSFTRGPAAQAGIT
jgi:hypothetical protein